MEILSDARSRFKEMDYTAPIFHLIAEAPAWLWKILNTNFSAALFGALAGAVGAHRIALRKERAERLIASIDATNTAIGLTNSIANVVIAIKRQHLVDLIARYRAQFAQLGQAEAAAMAGGPIVFNAIADFRDVSVPTMPIEPLLEIVTRIGPSVKVGSLAQSLRQAIEGFRNSVEIRRNTILILQTLTDDEKMRRYYGLRIAAGIDEIYPDAMFAIETQCDDCIYFSMLLAEVLIKHGEKLPELLKRKRPTVVKISYDAVPAEILPDRDQYSDFEKQYRAEPTQKEVTAWSLLRRRFVG